MKTRAQRQQARADRRAAVAEFQARAHAEAAQIQAAAYRNDLPRLHGNAAMIAAQLTPVGAALGVVDRLTGKQPCLFWNPERGEYLTKDGRTMAQVAAGNQARRQHS